MGSLSSVVLPEYPADLQAPLALQRAQLDFELEKAQEAQLLQLLAASPLSETSATAVGRIA